MNINQSALDPPEPNATDKQQTAFSFVHDPSKSTADVTAKLVMELEDDLELDVEEFFRLRRLGRFKDAKEYYKARLQHHNDLPYVRLIYAEMLFATGDYAAFHTVPRMFSRSQDELHHSHDSLIQRNHEFLCVLVQSRNLEPIDYGYVNELIRDSYSLLRRQMSISSAEVCS
jgi:Putative Zn-dependent protease, contains TPR repeats